MLKSQGKVIAKKVIHCDSIFKKATGLMFRRKLKDEAYIFTFRKERKIGLHMFFVFQSIEALWLNSDKKVVERAVLRPFTAYTPRNEARYVIELPEGKKVDVGSRISW